MEKIHKGTIEDLDHLVNLLEQAIAENPNDIRIYDASNNQLSAHNLWYYNLSQLSELVNRGGMHFTYVIGKRKTNQF